MDRVTSPPLLPPGIVYFDGFLSPEEEAAVTDRLDAGAWSTELKRRVQHFGYRYDYKARAVTADAYLGPLPPWLGVFAERLVTAGYCRDLPDQVIANEYLPGQGISAHVDCVPCFDDGIVVSIRRRPQVRPPEHSASWVSSSTAAIARAC